MRSSTSSSDGAPPGAGPGAPGDALGTDAPRPGAPGAYAPPRAPRGPVPFGGYAPPAPADRAPDALDAARRAPWEAPPAPERAVPALDFGRAARVALVCFAVLLGAWEAYWRTQGAVPGTVNSDGLWARARRQVNAGDPRATVFIGSSRTLSNVQLPVWARLEGRPPVQLALEGTSPIGALEDLAADTAFRDRRLVVGVTPPLFFTGFAYRQGVVDRARKETPSQRAGQWLGMTLVEPFLAFQDPDFGLFTVLARQPWPQRPGAEFRRMPPKLFVHSADRNARMWARLERDTAYQRVVQQIWARNFRPPPGPPPPGPPPAEAQIARAVRAVAALRARGVEVVFVRHPSSGPFLAAEQAGFPRAATWDVLLSRTGARGVHFEDHPQLQGMRMPEWSHMSAADADRYTAALYPLVARPVAAAVGAAR